MIYTVSKNYFSGKTEELIQTVSEYFQLKSNYLIVKVNTLLNIKIAIFDRKPITKHLISIIKNNKFSEQNFIWVKIGTSVKSILFKYVKNLEIKNMKIIFNNLFTGFELVFIDIPINEIIDCLFIYDNKKIKNLMFLEHNCINCGYCIKVCPVGLSPKKLFFFVKDRNNEETKKSRIFECIECGACSYICPSNISLLKHFRSQKMRIKILENKNKKIELARKFYESKKNHNSFESIPISEIFNIRNKNEILKKRKIFVENAIARVKNRREKLKITKK